MANDHALQLKIPPVAAPGIALGTYPERRRSDARSPAWQAWARNLIARRGLARYQACVARARTLEREFALDSEAARRQRISALRAGLACEGFTAERVAEALALVSLVGGRALGAAPYDTQLFAAHVLLDGHLAEMATGEGKTLAAGIAAAIAALAGIPVHLVTANDYLVARDWDALRPLYSALGLASAAVTHDMASDSRRAAYGCDIVYCTAKELVFDYLRDRLVAPPRSALEERATRLAGSAPSRKLLRGLCMAIIDEADSVLIDEARVPLILSQPAAPEDSAPYREAWRLSAAMQAPAHFRLDPDTRSARLTAEGRRRLKELLAARSHPWRTARHCEDAVALALAARHLFARGRDFLVKDGRIEIIDETTGRIAHGRSWSEGLHQLLEIKEDCPPSPRVAPLIQITYQRFFQRYLRLCGLSGTLRESRYELLKVYGREIVPVPLRRPNRREVLPARVFTLRSEQWDAVLERAQALHAAGRPLLVGTGSVAESEALSRRFHAAGLPHAVRNAHQDRHEAAVIAAAGSPGAITISTNMAGRGTDIVLRGESADLGGLHVICCQQNTARRIDRQLVGRCARQGDPGSAEMFVALDGALLGRHWLARLVAGCAKRGELRHAWLGVLAFRLAQRAAERRQRIERELLMRRDDEVSQSLAFSGREH